MRFAVVGMSYEHASLSDLEKVVFTDTKKMEMYVLLQQRGIRESVIVSTCNRSEIYFLYEQDEQMRAVIELYQAFFQLDSVNIDMKSDQDALVYLYEVSNGLHSLVLGEDQIIGQIVKSEEFARENGQSKKVMNHIFRDVIHCSKQAKTKFRISEHPLSLSYVAVDVLKKTCGVDKKTALVLGSGKMSTLAMRYLIEAHAQKIYVANRNETKANEVIAELKNNSCQLEAVSFASRYEILKVCDLVLSATSSPHTILKAEKMPVITHELVMVDMASPRDIDPSIGQLAHVHVEDMESLQQRIVHNHEIRQEKVSDIKCLIQEEVEKTMQWMDHVQVDGTLETLQQHIASISTQTYEILTHKLTLSEREKMILKKTLNVAMLRLMQPTILTLKNEEDKEKQKNYEQVLKELFQLEKKR